LAAIQRACKLESGDAVMVSRDLKVDTFLLGAFGKAFFGLVEGGGDAAVAFGVGDVALERISAEDEVGRREKLARVGILRIGTDGSLETALGGGIVAGTVRSLAGAGEGR
jgi:hypothetical protein